MEEYLYIIPSESKLKTNAVTCFIEKPVDDLQASGDFPIAYNQTVNSLRVFCLREFFRNESFSRNNEPC